MSTSTAKDRIDAVEEPLPEEEYRDRLRDLPPSAKLVAKVLETDAPLSQGQLAEESLLPDRTVRYALNRLEDVGLVGSRYSFRDARKQVYFLNH
ncbi:MarR family transcriptional regulator [Natrarchaeobius oligotrophus]|uniref:MarR family transcriptional regulator n=1 Tax=Natrarchaeobius chitinivorans TaxID=1679083 RepID=A0A3N6N2X1_NATCH|nr:helix-turn-helix domain-containing protein [Natrarchaeobius chitinivorans]RQH03222.1 MarR family transcriptional regulator [Natrarchaeobius chitinivorans]